MKKILLPVILLFPVTLCLSQPIRLGGPVDPAVDPARLARIDTLVNDYIAKGWINGLVTLFVKDKHIIQYKEYGYSDKEGNKRMRRDDLFRLASQTKAVATVGLMILYEEGKFYLDEPVSDFIPSFKNPRVLDKFNEADSSYTTVPAKREVTIRDLLTHTSGIDYPAIGSENMRAIYAKAHIPSGLTGLDNGLKERMEALGKLPLAHQPGEKWTYGLGIDVAGCLVEIMSGMDFESWLSKKLFRPLGMKDTYFNVPAAKAGRLVKVYTQDSLRHIIPWPKGQMDLDPDYPLLHHGYFSGGAGLTSTTYDYAIFLQMLLNGGQYNGVRILSPRTVRMMTSNQLSFLYDGIDHFGLSFSITSELSAAREVRNEGSYSWGGFFGTTYWVDPKAHLIGLVMFQQNPISHGELETKIEQLIYQSLR